MWPDMLEDALRYYGVSCWDSPEQAIETAQHLNAVWEAKGKGKRWTHVVELTIDGHAGHVLIRDQPEGHLSVFAEAKALYSTAGEELPIPE